MRMTIVLYMSVQMKRLVKKLLVAVNRTAQRKQLCMVQEWETASALLGKAVWNGTLTLEPYGYALLFSGK